MKTKFKLLVFVLALICFTTFVYAGDKVSFENVDVAKVADEVYTGKAITPEPVVTSGETVLVKDIDYTVSYKNNKKIGTATVTITGIGDYEGTKTVTFRIGYDISKAKVTGVVNKTYTGAKQGQKITVKYGKTTLKDKKDYSVSYKDNVKAGTATLVITGKGNYIGKKEVKFTIARRSIANLTFNKIGNKTYIGTALTPGVKVTYGKTALVKDTDFTVTYTNNVKVGTATITVRGIGNYSGKKTITFKVVAKSVSDINVEGLVKKYYTGSKIKQKLTLTYKDMVLVDGKDYTLAYKNNVNVGKATVTITGKGNYTGTKTYTFKIGARNIADLNFEEISKSVYTGKAIKPNVVVKNGTKVLKAGTEYTISYKNNINVGTATVTVKGVGNYAGEKIINFEIGTRGIARATVTGLKNKNYTGNKIGQSLVITYNSKTLKEGVDYTLAYKDNINAGTATVTIIGKGNFAGENNLTYTINPVTIENYTFTKLVNKTYTGNPVTQEINVKNGVLNLEKDTDYTVSYKNNTNVGTATVTVTGIGNYTGTKTFTFKIVSENISKVNVTEIGEHIYTGNAITPAVTLTYNGRTLVSGKDYTVSYTNNVNVGTATITLTGKGNLTGTIRVFFQIREAEPLVPEPEPSYYNQFDAGEIFLKVGDYGCLNYTNDLAGKTIESLSSTDTNVIVVSRIDESLTGTRTNCINDGDVYIDAVGEGYAEVVAEATDGTIGKCKVHVSDSGIKVIKNQTSYSVRGENEGAFGGNLSFGQSAASILGAVGLEKTNGYEYNHPSGLAYYKKGEIAYFVVTDAWNNRVLIYTGTDIQDATSKNPTYILGQKDENTSTPGYELYEMNWPMDCAIDSTGRLYVADTHNNRILVYDDITDLKTTTDENSQTRIVADHEIAWWNEEKQETHNDHLYWPWSVAVANVGGTEKLIVTSTLGHKILIWNEIPESWGGLVSENYPDLVLETEDTSTPRTVTWTGEQLLIGDENIHDYGSGIRVFNEFPTVENVGTKAGVTRVDNENQTILKASNSKVLEDFVLTNTGDIGFNSGYGEGVMAGGKLYMAFGCALHVWTDGRIDNDKDSGIYTFQMKEITYSEEGGCFLNGGGIYKLLYAENNLYLALHNGNFITGWKNIGVDKLISSSNETFRATSKPDIYVGTQEFENSTKNLPASDYVKHNQIPLTDGKHLIVLDDLDQQVMVYKNIPTSSGAIADYIYEMPYGLGEGAIRKYTENGTEKTALILQSRTHNVIYIWTDYKFDGSMPDRVIGNNIGSKHLTGELVHIEFDGTYTYISTVIKEKPQVLIYEGLINKNSEPISVLDVSVDGVYIHDNNLSISSNGEYVSFMYDGFKAYIFKTTQFTNSTLTLEDAYGIVKDFEIGEEPNEENDPQDFNACRETGYRIVTNDGRGYHERTKIGMNARTLITSDGKYIVSDMEENRILIWNSVEDAIMKDGLPAKEPTVLGHGKNLYDLDELIGGTGAHDIQEATFEDTFFMPLYVAYDGYNLWVGEFKFSNRLLRFELK